MKSPMMAHQPIALHTGLRRYGQVILALLLREEESRRRAPMESIVNLLEPIWMIAGLAFLWWFLGQKRSGMLGGSPVLFYSTGFFANYFFIYISRRMPLSIERPNRRFPIETRLDHIIVHVMLRTADYIVLGVLGFGLLYFFITPDALPYDIVPVAQAMLAIMMLGFGWGIFNLVVTRFFWLWGRVYPVFNRAMLLLSGVLFIADFLPPATRHIASFNPLLHAIALFRTGFYPQYPTLVLDTTYLAWCAVFFVVLGLVLERVTQRVVQA